LRGDRRAARAADLAHRPGRDGRDRHHPADRHRQEERDHDDRLRARRGAQLGQEPARSDQAGVPAALPPDRDDHGLGAARRAAADARHRRRIRAPPPARHHDGRRADPVAADHAFYYARDLPVVRSPGAAGHASRASARMNPSEPFIRRPVATTLLTLGIALAGIMAFKALPVAPLPQVDFPTISVTAQLPGASPEIMAATVAMPLERALGRIAGVTEITSGSSLGSSRITLQFELSRNIDGAARDVQGAINAAMSQLPSGLPNNPTYRKV